MHPMKTPLLIAKFAPLAIVATLAVVGAVYAHVALPNPAAAQDTPSVAISLSPSGSVEPGTAITVSMSFGNLASDTDTKTTDYIFRADVLDSDNEAADACEGGGMGKDRYFYQVDDDPETREATVSADCPAGDYTVQASLSSAANEELASASAAFSVATPPDPSVTVELSPSDFVEEGAEITAVMSFGDLASDSDTSTIDYVVRADVLDSEDGAADDCEGNGLGADRNINKVDEDPETRTGTVSADCPAGAYTLRVSIHSAGNTELASASAGFFILRAPVVIEPPTLTALSVSHGDPAVEVELSPAFNSETLAYRAAVRVAQVTVAPTASDADATVAYLDGNGDAIADADPVAAGHQVDLEAGSNTVKVAVSKDGLTTTYTVKLFRLVTQQQTADVTLVSNTGNAAAGGVAITAAGHKRAQQFTTGSNTGGYNLASVGVDIHTTPGEASGLVVTLRTEDSGNPSDTNPITLTTPATLTTGVNTFAAPANTVLSASTDYFIHLAYTGTGTDPQATWTRNNDQDGETGWSIRNGMHWYTNSWSGLTVPIKIQVTGSAVSGMPPPQSSDATLSELSLVNAADDAAIALTPTFVPGTTHEGYTASVASGVATATVTATATHDEAEAVITPTDADSNTAGHQVTLTAGGETEITVEVTAEDAATTKTYTVTVTRAAAGASVVTLNLDATTIAEDSGTAVNVTATLSAAKTTQFTVTVSAASPATDAAYTLSANTTLTFTANATESTGTVTITPVNNTDNERDKVITVSGAVAAGVTGVTSPADVTLTIEDDDHPVVTHTLTLHRNNAAKTLLDPTVIPENVG